MKKTVAGVVAAAMVATAVPAVAPNTTPEAQAQLQVPANIGQQISQALSAIVAIASIVGIIIKAAEGSDSSTGGGSSDGLSSALDNASFAPEKDKKYPVNMTEAQRKDAGKAIFNRINKYREENGLKALTWSEQHYAQSVEVGKLQAERGDLYHPGLHNVYENLALDYGFKVRNDAGRMATSAFTSWKNSQGHDANMLQEETTVGAVAVYPGVYKGYNTYFFVFQAN